MDRHDIIKQRGWTRLGQLLPKAVDHVRLCVDDFVVKNLPPTMALWVERCQSEEQAMFLTAWMAVAEANARSGHYGMHDGGTWGIVDPDVQGGWDHFEQMQKHDFWHEGPEGCRADYIAPQYPIGGHPVDFLCVRFDYDALSPEEYPATGPVDGLRQCRPCVVEIGLKPGSRRRDRQLQALGYSVARFTNPEIVADPLACAVQVDDLLTPTIPHDQWRRPPKPPARAVK